MQRRKAIDADPGNGIYDTLLTLAKGISLTYLTEKSAVPQPCGHSSGMRQTRLRSDIIIICLSTWIKCPRTCLRKKCWAKSIPWAARFK